MQVHVPGSLCAKSCVQRVCRQPFQRSFEKHSYTLHLRNYDNHDDAEQRNCLAALLFLPMYMLGSLRSYHSGKTDVDQT